MAPREVPRRAYGSGKTHFLRHFSEISRRRTCVTSEVQLNKSIDLTRYLAVFRKHQISAAQSQEGESNHSCARASRLARVLAKSSATTRMAT